MVLLHWYIKKVVHLVQQNALCMYFFHKFLSQFLGFNGFFRAFREIFPSKMPHCTCFICPIYKIRIGASSVITPVPIHIYYNCISKICQSACFAPRRNTSRKMARASGPQYSSCFSSWLPRQPSLLGTKFLSKGYDRPDIPHRKRHFVRSICHFSRTAQFYVFILVHSANRQINQEYV